MGLIPNVECVINMMKLYTTYFPVHHLVLLPVIGPIEYKNRHMTESANTSNRKSVNIKKGHTIKSGMNINQNLFLLKQSSSKSFRILHYIDMLIIDANKPDVTFKDKNQLFIKLQCLRNENRMDVAPKININTCSCGSSWYSKIRYKQKFAANP